MPLRKGRSINQEDIWLREDASETEMGVKTTLQPSAPFIECPLPKDLLQKLEEPTNDACPFPNILNV